MALVRRHLVSLFNKAAGIDLEVDDATENVTAFYVSNDTARAFSVMVGASAREQTETVVAGQTETKRTLAVRLALDRFRVSVSPA